MKPGQKVLINGAGGATGTFAVQLARLYGAEVTGVDDTSKLDFMRSLGADHVIDYTQEDFSKNGQQYDLILDLIAHHSTFAYKRALGPKGSYFAVGGSMTTLLQILLLGPWIRTNHGQEDTPSSRFDRIWKTLFTWRSSVKPARSSRSLISVIH